MNEMPNTYLVAGGAGFIGSHLCAAFLDQGHKVIAVDNLSTGRAENVADLEGEEGFRLVVADITRPDHVVDVVAAARGHWSPDVVIHLASPASPVDYGILQVETLMANSLGTLNLLTLAAEQYSSFIYASTSEVYGEPAVHPQPESYRGDVDPVGPRSMYDEAKRFGEALVTAHRRRRGVRAAIVRIFNTYGPGMSLTDGRVIPEFIRVALEGRPLPISGNGSQTRSFMFITDLIRALTSIAADPALDGQLVNVGNPEEVTVNELGRRFRDIVSETGGTDPGVIRVPERPDDPSRRCPDISRVSYRYGWRPEVSLAEGLRLTWEAYRR